MWRTYRVRTKQDDPGFQTLLHFDDATGQMHIEKRQSDDSIMDILRGNDAVRDHNKMTRGGNRLRAEVPIVVEQQWAREAGVRWNSQEFHEVAKRKLEDSDFRKFRLDR